jgi:GTP cyclohydrolase I
MATCRSIRQTPQGVVQCDQVEDHYGLKHSHRYSDGKVLEWDDKVDVLYTPEAQTTDFGPPSGKVDMPAIEDAVRTILVAIGEDPDRDGLKKTPHRVAKAWSDFIDYDPGNTDVTFEVVNANQLVVCTGMHIYSYCEHHMLPFEADVAVGYLPADGGRVLGLSKMPRVVQQFAHGLQLQEQLGEQIANEIVRLCEPRGVGVVIRGRHMCMSMRGVRMEGAMVTSVVKGLFRDAPQVRSEFYAAIGFGGLSWQPTSSH